ncbi:MAG TPA: YhfC family glutamic-type intramembrane protease [Methanomicrobiales archaeon]|nr:YhfC family glutamic-type intramembrane protease [Methanomicrobiales archaeon]
MDTLVVLTFIFVILVEIIFPLLVGYWIIRRFNVPWKLFTYGIIFFIIVQVFHTPLVLSTQLPLLQFLTVTVANQTIALAIFAAILGILAGLFEEIGRYLVFTYFFPWRGIDLSKENGLLFGAGWGGIESIAIGGLLILTLVSYIVAAPLTEQQLQELNQSLGGTLTEEQVQALQNQNQALRNLTPWDILPGLFERFSAFILQIAFTLLVLTAVVQGRLLLLGLAIFWHALVDFFAVFLSATVGILVTEATLAALALIGIWFIWWVWRRGVFEADSRSMNPG